MLIWMAMAAATANGPAPAVEKQPLIALHQDPAKAEDKKEDDAYTKLIAGFTTEKGPFTVHTKDETVYFELSDDVFGKDFLWMAEMKETPEGQLYNGTSLGSYVIRFEKRGDRVLMRQMSFTNKATSGEEIKKAVEQSNVNPILYAFESKGKGKDGATVIDVSRLFKGDQEFPVGQAVGNGGMDASRSFLDHVHVFPENVNVQVTVTYRAGRQTIVNPFFTLIGGPSAGTGVVTHSMVKLPEKPMMGRLFDSRVGYFSNGYVDYGLDGYQGSKSYQYINRYRLEKKDPKAELSEPVKPIVYYISREVPAKWRKYCIDAVEQWNEAFEAAGFKNAIRAELAPDDPKWSPEDARYSVIRWAPRPIANAMGPSITDPRSGEIINAHIIMWHDVLKLAADWYFAQASPNDPRAQRYPFGDELMGELLQTVVAHEVGHTLGLPHNGKSSSTVPVKLLRDPEWTRKYGTAPSIMDYARFNYVAQPGDNAALLMKISMYDNFSIMWGYKPIEHANTPFMEKPTLDAWASRQVAEPMLRFYDNFNSMDPSAQSEALGDDAMEASTLGVANLKRVMGYLMPATTKFGEDYEQLDDAHGAVVDQFRLYMSHVAVNIGGIEQTDYHAGRGGLVYNPTTYNKQHRAVKWLLENAVTEPSWLFPKEVMLRIGSSNGAAELNGIANSALNTMLANDKVTRMLENEAANGGNAFSVREMMTMIRGTVWAELSQPRPVIDYKRRVLQKNYINLLASKLSGNASEIRTNALGELRVQEQAIKAALPRVNDDTTKAHLSDVLLSIKRAIEMPPAAAGGAASQNVSFPFMNDPFEDRFGCCYLHGRTSKKN